MKKRSKAGTLFRMLAALVLENIRGLNETIQYGKGNERMELMNSRTDALSQKQSALNKLTGTNIAIANTFILIFDAAPMFVAWEPQLFIQPMYHRA